MMSVISENKQGAQQSKLQGHEGSVLCLDHSSSIRKQSPLGSNTATSGYLLSGSEDKTCRLWDLRAIKSSVCIQCPGEVLSVAFDQPTNNAETGTNDNHDNNYSIYAAVENAVYAYDLRMSSTPIVTQPTALIIESSDEINQILIMPTLVSNKSIVQLTTSSKSSKGKDNNKNRRQKRTANTSTSESDNPKHDTVAGSDPDTFLAAADDTGAIHIRQLLGDDNSDSQIKQQSSLYHGTDESPAIVTSIAWRNPSCVQNLKAKGSHRTTSQFNFLASGGTDCQIKLWDLKNFNTTNLIQTYPIRNSDAGTNQVCNPPMVHSLSWSPSGRLLTAALGDGTIGIWEVREKSSSNNNNTIVMTARLEDAHNGPAASAIFPEWGCSSCGNEIFRNEVHDRLLCTAGNDCRIILWDLGVSIGGEKARNPSNLLNLLDDSLIAGVEHLTLNASKNNELEFDRPEVLLAMQHNNKPNWITSSRGITPASIFVADTSCDITIYNFPVR